MLRTAEREQLRHPRQSRIDLDQPNAVTLEPEWQCSAFVHGRPEPETGDCKA
jgi:hypothetical protein